MATNERDLLDGLIGSPDDDPNVHALKDGRVRDFLDRIGTSEGADYNTLVGGKRINDLSTHPNQVGLVTSAGPSTAFGKYQIVHSTEKSKLAKYNHLDYSPGNQDLRAVELLRQSGALQAIMNDDYETAMRRAGREWASIPGSAMPGRKNHRAFAGILDDADLRAGLVAGDSPTSLSPDTAATTIATPALSPEMQEMAQVSQAARASTDPAAKVGDITDKYLRIARGEAPPEDTAPIKTHLGRMGAVFADRPDDSTQATPLTVDDAAWHFGMTPEQAQRLSNRQKRVLTAAVTEDQRKRAAGEDIAPPSLGYQNQMRAKAGLKPLVFNQTPQMQIGTRTFTGDPDTAISPYYQVPENRTREILARMKAGNRGPTSEELRQLAADKTQMPDLGFESRGGFAFPKQGDFQQLIHSPEGRQAGIIAEEKNRTVMPGDPTLEARVNSRLQSEGMNPLDFDQATDLLGSRVSAAQRRKNVEYISVLESGSPEDKQRAIYRRAQSISNREQAALRSNQPGTLNRVFRDLSLVSPVTAVGMQLLGSGPGDEPGIRAAAGGTGPGLLGRLMDTAADVLHFVDKSGNTIDTLGGSIEGNKYVHSALGQFTNLGNSLREGSAYLKGSADLTPQTGTEEFGKEFGSALGGIGEIVILRRATGLPFWAIMGSQAALRSQDQPIATQAKHTAVGVATGLAMEYGPTVARKLLGKLPGAVGTLVQKFPGTTEGIVSAGGFGTMTGVQRYQQGATPTQAIAAGLGTAAGMALLTGSEFKREAKEIAPEVIASEKSPEWLRRAASLVTGDKPAIVVNESGDRAASVYVNPETKGQIIREIKPDDPLVTEGKRPQMTVADDQFDLAMNLAGLPREGTEANAGVAPINRQITDAIVPPQTTTEDSAPSSPAVGTIADLGLSAEERALREQPATPPTPTTPRIPEASPTIEAQMNAMVNGRGSRKAVFIPPGQEVPDIPKGFRATETQHGTVIYPASMSPKALRQSIKSGESYQLLGHANAESPDATRVVVARAGKAVGGVKVGDELMSSYVVPGNEPKAEAEMKAQFAPYEPQIEIGGAETEKGVAEQRTNTTNETIDTAAIRNPDGSVTVGRNHPQILLSQGKKVPKDRSGPEYGFVTSSGRFVSRAEAATIAGVPNTIAEGQLYTEDLTAVRKAKEARAVAAESGGVLPEPAPSTVGEPGDTSSLSTAPETAAASSDTRETGPAKSKKQLRIEAQAASERPREIWDAAHELASHGVAYALQQNHAIEPAREFLKTNPSDQELTAWLGKQLGVGGASHAEGARPGVGYHGGNNPKVWVGPDAMVGDSLKMKPTYQGVALAKAVRELFTAEAPSEPATLAAKPEFQHVDFGHVVEAVDQVGVEKGHVRVVDDAGESHEIQRPNKKGAGNQKAVPLKGASDAGTGEIQPERGSGDRSHNRQRERTRTEPAGGGAPGIRTRPEPTQVEETETSGEQVPTEGVQKAAPTGNVLADKSAEWRQRLATVTKARDSEGLRSLADEMSEFQDRRGLATNQRLTTAIEDIRRVHTAISGEKPRAQSSKAAATADDDLSAIFDDELSKMSEAAPVKLSKKQERIRAAGRPIAAVPPKPAATPAAQLSKKARRAATSTSAEAGGGSSLADVAKGLSALFQAPAATTSERQMDAGFNQATYDAAKPLFEAGMAHFKKLDTPAQKLRALMQTLRQFHGFELGQIAAMKPYVIQYVREVSEPPKTLETPTEKADNKADVVTDQTEAISDRAPGDGVQRAGDVRGPKGVEPTATGVRRTRRSRAPNAGRSDVGSDESITDNAERRPDVTDSETLNVEPPSRGDSDLSGNRISYPSDADRERELAGKHDYIAPVGSLRRQGSWRETARTNLDVLELVKRLEAESRLATPDEQALLVKFTGWGASEIANNLFPGTNWNRYGQAREILPEYAREGWRELAERAKELFTPEELETALSSTQYAHYTSEAVIRGIWEALNNFGFTGGSIVEPGMGVGLFASAAPRTIIQQSKYTGIELDKLTAAIAKHVLQRQAVINADFVKQKLPKNFFDVAIGNPPFSRTIILDDPAYKKFRFALHDYFFAKSIDSVRPGGLLVFVTSHHTMDKGNDAMRKYIDERADLLGAIRLPQTAFKQNAGTEVVTDVLFLRKRLKDEPSAGESWLGREDVTGATKNGADKTAPINEYFVVHPEMVLGKHAFTGTMRGADEYTVEPAQGDIEEQFREAVQKLPSGVYRQPSKAQEVVKQVAERDWNPDSTKEGSLYLDKDGKLRRVDNGSGVMLRDAEPGVGVGGEKWLTSYVGLRKALKQAQYDQLHDGDWEASLKELNRQYDAFTKKFGPISEFSESERTFVDSDGNETTRVYRRFKNQKYLALDVESPLVSALERITEDGKIEKGSMLLRRTIKPPAEAVIRTLSDALAVSLDKVGTLNLGHVAELMAPVQKMTREEIIRELGDSIFEEPGGQWQMSDEYLSGYVIDKLEEAEAAARLDRRFERNIEALRKVQPKPLEAASIAVSLGATWVPPEVVSQFAKEELGFPSDSIQFNPVLNKWTVHGAEGAGSRQRRSASATWGTKDRSPNEILDAALNGHSIKITYKDDKGKTFVDEEASAKANDVLKKMRDAFRTWLWTDAERTQTLVARYNRQFNNIAPRQFNGDHLTLPGLSAVYALHGHQKRVVWRVLQTGDTYLAHAVGSGKTLEMIVSGMEQRRLGLISKPMYTVPNHMLRQFASEFLDAYPMANILVADESNFSKENRKRFVAQAALNDLDAVIITHSAFGLVRAKQETSDVVVDELVGQLFAAIDELDENDRTEKRTIKELEQRIESIRRRFQSKAADEKRDDVVDFEDLGVDFLYVDEAHKFRKLDFVTNHEKIKGVDPNGSQMALDLLIKLRWLATQRPKRSVVMASGTPITNTLAELYSIQRFMDMAELERAELSHFDAWAAQFGEVHADYEMNAAGKYELVERFSKFINIPELMKRVRQFMDVLTMKQLSTLINVPTIKGGAPEVVVVPASAATTAYLTDELDRRIKISRAWKPSKDQPGNPDPLINIITDGRLSAIDMRFVDRAAENDPGSKLNQMIDSIIERYNRDRDIVYHSYTGPDGERVQTPDKIKGATQIVFSPVGFGSQVSANRGFDAQKWMLKRFIDAGIPASEVAFMSNYKKAAAKEQLFKEMRQGTKTILIGSPQNMGTGVNAQKRLLALHFLSPPWFPADVEQPDGRIIRQGNQNPEVEIRRYATKGTYDSTGWQMNARKARAIEQAMSGDDSMRTLEDISESSLYEQASALAAGDARAIQLAGLRRDVERLSRLERAHWQEQADLRSDRKRAERNLNSDRDDAEKLAKAIDEVGGFIANDAFHVTVGDKKIEKRTEIGDAIKSAWLRTLKDNKKKAIESKKALLVDLGIQAQGKFPLKLQVDETGHGIQSRVSMQIGPVSRSITNDGRFDSIAQPEEFDSAGLATRISNALNGLHREFSDVEQSIAQHERSIKQIDAKLGQPFPEESELYEKTADLNQLQREMAATVEEEQTPALDTETGDEALAARGWESYEGGTDDLPEIRVHGNRVIYTGGEPAQLLDAAMKQPPTGMEHTAKVGGVFLSRRHDIRTLVSRLREAATPVAVQLADAISQAGKNGPVLIASAGRVSHEAFHETSSDSGTRKLEDRHADLEGLTTHALFNQMRVKLLLMGYPDSAATLVEEAAAHLAEGHYEDMGVTRDEAVEWMTAWFQSFVKKNGRVSVEKFRELANEAQKALNTAILAQTEETENQRTDEGLSRISQQRSAGTGTSITARAGPGSGAGPQQTAAYALEADPWAELDRISSEMEPLAELKGRATTEFPAGIKNALTDEELRAEGQKEINVEGRRSVGTVFDTARANFDPETATHRMIAFAEKPRALAPEETAEMIILKTHLRNEYEKAANALLEAQDKGDDALQVSARLRLAKLAEDLLTYHEMARKTGYEQGLGLKLRAEMMLADYSLASVMTRALVANNNQEIPEHVQRLLEQLIKQRDEAVTALKQYDEEAAQRAAEAELRRLQRQERLEKKRERGVVTRTVLEDEFAKLSQQFARAAARLSANPFFDPMLYSIIGRMARNRVSAGVGSVDELVGSIFEAVKDHVEDGTQRDLRDAISGYGKSERLTQDEITKQLSELKKAMRDLSAVEDGITRGEKPFTGKASPKVREAAQRVESALRDDGNQREPKVHTPEDRQAAALQVLKNRLRSRIDDLQSHLAGQSRPERGTPLATDDEAKALIAERDRLKAALDEMDAQPPKTMTERIKKVRNVVRESVKKAAPSQKRAAKQMQSDVEDATAPTDNPEAAALKQLKARLNNRRAKLAGQLQSGNYEKKKARRIPQLDEDALHLQAEVKKLERQIDAQIHKLKRANLGGGERALDLLVKLRRMGALSSTWVLGKLTNAASWRVALTLGEEIIGAPLPYLPVIGKVARRAPREGYLSLRAEARALATAFSGRMVQQALQAAKTGLHDIDLQYGDKKEEPPELTEFFGRIHTALKTAPKLAEFTRSHTKRLESIERAGRDASDPVEMFAAATAALPDAYRAIFMQDNMVSSGFSHLMRMFATNKKAPALGKIIAAGGRLLFPVTRVPPNYITEALNYTAGGVTATARLVIAAAKYGLDDVPPEMADQIIRGYKKQGMGFVFLMLGILSALGLIKSIEVGGYYQKGEKRKENEVPAGRIRILGHNIPSWAGHVPAFELLQIGATLVRVSAAYKGKGEEHPWLAGTSAAAGGLAAEVPFFEEPVRAAEMVEGPYEGKKKYLGDLAGGMMVPPDIQRIAKAGDQQKPTTAWDKAKILTGFMDSKPVKRDTPTIASNIESRLPILRNRLPVKSATTMGANRTQMTPALKEMERLDMHPKTVRRYSIETPESYHARMVAEGESALAQMEQTVSQPWYKALKTKQQKVKAINGAILAGRKMARSKLGFVPPIPEGTPDEDLVP